MDKETLSNYGWIVICVMILAVLLALATPFGHFIAEGFKAIYTGFGLTSNNALGVIIPGADEPHEPNTLYYYQPYRFDFEDGYVFEAVFHKDGVVDFYMNDNGKEYGEVSYEEESLAVYGEGTVMFQDTEFTISEDGTKLTADGVPEGILIPTEIHNMCMDTEYVCKDEKWQYNFNFHTDGSYLYREYFWGVEECHRDSKECEYTDTMKYFNEYLENHRYVEWRKEVIVDRWAIYPDGSKIIAYGHICYIDINGDVDCKHINTEIRNQTDVYTGDEYCKDCNKLLGTGQYNKIAYAVYTEEDDVLWFIRPDTEPKVGDKYNGNTITHVFADVENPEMYDDSDSEYDLNPWNNTYFGEMKSVIIVDKIKPITLNSYFATLGATYFDIRNLDATGTTNMNDMFNCTGRGKTITVVGLGTLDTSNIKTMKQTFENCSYVENLEDIKNWDVSNVEDMEQMFNSYACEYTGDITINLSNDWRTISLKNTYAMFASVGWERANSVYIDIDNWYHANVIDKKHIFYNTGLHANEVKIYCFWQYF